jgi:hypothetical protein
VRSDYTIALWLLKLGAPLNLYFLLNLPDDGEPLILWPARIFFAVCAFRCLFPARYEHNVVFHDSIFSSIFLARMLATFAEIAYIVQFAHVLRVLDTEHSFFVSALSSVMVAQVLISQVMVWAAILTGRLALYFYEELGWALIFTANTLASAYLLLRTHVAVSRPLLLQASLVFGAVYLPWQLLHLRMLRANATQVSVAGTSHGLLHAIRVRHRRTDAKSWGGVVGLSWMAGYWATITPAWVYAVARLLVHR